jgi:hypothetical protein
VYVIEDWAGDRKFPDRTFPTFDEGIEFLHEQFPDSSEDREEFFVVQADD